MLANRNELKSVGREEMKLVNAEGLFSRVFLLRRTKKWGGRLVLCVQLYVYGGQICNNQGKFSFCQMLTAMGTDLLKERGT